MATNQNNIQTNITVATNAGQANQQLTTTQQLLQNISQQQTQLNQTVAQGSQQQTAALVSQTKATNNLAKGFKGVGLAFKSIGIGLILEAFNVLKDIFSQNQLVSDGFATGIKALSIAFNDLFSFISKNAGAISGFFKNIFDDPVESIKKFGTAIKDNLIERFKSYIDTLGILAKGLKELFTGNFSEATKQFKAAAKESVDIFTGVNNTVDRTTKAVKEVAEAVANYTTNITKQAYAMVQIENRAKIATAQNAKLIELYDRAAEKQRQLRDDEADTIENRITANTKLGKILEEQSKAMLANANIVVQQAQNAYALNKNIDNQVKLIEAQTEKSGILAQIEGFRSEQIVNRIALEKELNELNQTAIDGANERAKVERDFATSQIKDDTDRLAAQRKAIEAELELETYRLTKKRDLYKEGTQAYEDANQELLTSQQNLNNQLTTNDKQTQETLKNENLIRINAIISDNRIGFDERKEALDEQTQIINETEYSSEEARTAAVKENTEARKQLAKEELNARVTALNEFGNVLGAASELAKEGTATQKTLAVAGTTINTFAAAFSSYKGMVEAIPGPIGIAAGIAAAAAATISGIASVKRILAVKVPGGGGGSAPAISGGMGSAPKFNTVGASGTNQLAETIAQQQGNVPVAQVVGSQVTTQQALDRQVINNATFI